MVRENKLQIGIITRSSAVFKGIIRVDLKCTSTEGFVRIEQLEQVKGRTFTKVYALCHPTHYFHGMGEIIEALQYRGVEIIYL